MHLTKGPHSCEHSSEEKWESLQGPPGVTSTRLLTSAACFGLCTKGFRQYVLWIFSSMHRFYEYVSIINLLRHCPMTRKLLIWTAAVRSPQNVSERHSHWKETYTWLPSMLLLVSKHICFLTEGKAPSLGLLKGGRYHELLLYS